MRLRIRRSREGKASKRVVAVGVSALLAIGFGTTVAAVQPDSPASSTEVAPGEGAASADPPVRSVPDVVADEMGVFRGSKRQPAAEWFISAAPLDALAKSGDALPGENPTLARSVEAPRSGHTGYLWPMRRGACFSVENAGGCASVDELQDAGGVASTLIVTPAGTRVAGIAIDGIDEVRVMTRTGDEFVAPVTDNFFSLDVAGVPSEVRWMVGGRPEAASLGAPPGSAMAPPPPD